MSAMAQHPHEFSQILVHTGQHYDKNLSDVFFEELDLPQPTHYLGVGSGTHAQQTARVMMTFEPVLEAEKPDLVVVVGDVNSTLACTLVCAKLGVPVAHVEAGLRSFDMTMPEEVNRLVTDRLSDLLFTPSLDADENLVREGVNPAKIHRVGNVMIDTLVRLLPKATSRWIEMRESIGCERYVLVTLHRPSNVDMSQRLQSIMAALHELSYDIDIVFPVHPRTKQRLSDDGYQAETGRLHLIDALGYLDFLALESKAGLVITDSGGVQEETTYLGIPCLTVRNNTERPVTITQGTNHLVPGDPRDLVTEVRRVLASERPVTGTGKPDMWDGQAATRIIDVIREWRSSIGVGSHE